MVRCWVCPSCHQWGQRFQYGCRKCKIGQFKHRKCGRWVTAQYGFCPICYKDRLERKPKIKKLSKPKGTMPKGYGQDTRYVFTDKPTMPKGWITKIEQKKSRGRTICSQCGIQNTRNARFCSGCGSQLVQMCSTCKKLNPIGSSFCSDCGYALVISQTIEIKAPSSDKRNIEVIEANFRECILKEYNIKINYPFNWVRTTNDSNPPDKGNI